MMVDKVNSVSFGASLQTALRTPEAKLFMSAGERFQELTRKFPKDKLILQKDPLDKIFPTFAISDGNVFTINISNDFVKFDSAKNPTELVRKLVKTFKMLVECRKINTLMDQLDPDGDEFAKAAEASIKRMRKTAGQDGGLQEFVGAVQAGLGIE